MEIARNLPYDDLAMNATSSAILPCIRLLANGPIGIDDGLLHASMDISMSFLPRVYGIHINIFTMQAWESNIHTDWKPLIESRIDNDVVNNLRIQIVIPILIVT